MKSVHATLCAAIAICMPMSAFAQAPAKIASSSKLTEDAGKRDSWTYRNPAIALTNYQKFIIVPTVVYAAPTAQWGGSTSQQREKYAAYLTTALRKGVGEDYQIVDKPGPGVATMRLTLLGVKETTQGVATVTRVTPFGLALNGVKSLTGKKGSFTGSIQVAFELTDSRAGELIFAAVRERSPDALDIEATLSTEKTVEAVADDIAKAIKNALNKANNR